MALPLWRDLQEGRRLVATEVVAGGAKPEPWPQMAQFPHLLLHEAIGQVSYPYEWSTSMLADAGLLTLELQLALLNEGLGLKDASAYNVQFVKGRPIFIDAASVEEVQRRDVWFALGQFHRMFTYPLLLNRYRGWDLKSYFLGYPDGMSEKRMGLAAGMHRLRPAMLLDVGLPTLIQGHAQAAEHTAAEGGKGTGDPSGQVMNLKRLQRKLAALCTGRRLSGEWASYASECSYKGEQAAKREITARWLGEMRPKRVLDIGSNTGEYSFLAAKEGATVIALDADPDAVELLYRRVRVEQASITPMVADIACPSPATGFMNGEHEALCIRAKAECVLALAVIHHLAVSAALPLAAIRDMLWEYSTDWVVLEVVPESDPMFRKLMRLRRPLPERITLEAVKAVLASRFRVLAEERVGGTERHLLLLKTS